MPPFAAQGVAPPAETSEVGRPTRLPFFFFPVIFFFLSSSSSVLFFLSLTSPEPELYLAGTRALPRRNPKSSNSPEP
jgi:hypothetical protein